MTLERSRAALLGLVRGLDDAAFRAQFHPEFSPIGWHVGHVAFQEETFLLRRFAGKAPRCPGLDEVFDPFRSQKASRSRALPERAWLLDYAEGVRDDVSCLLLDRGCEPAVSAAARLVANHERQHVEHVATLRLLGGLYVDDPIRVEGTPLLGEEWRTLPGGAFVLGDEDDPDGWDNERRAHEVELPGFRLQRHAVSERAWLEFVEAGGYGDRRLWSEEGWAARVARRFERPLHWERDADGRYWKRTLRGREPIGGGCPVAHVSFYEAEAFASFRGARLPTEVEWEYAASWDPATRRKRRYPWGDAARADRAEFGLERLAPGALGSHPLGGSAFGVEDLCGGVWEWTSSAFRPYPGFVAGTYAAYSAPWFGEGSRVVRGGSFATAPENARSSFRNWYGLHQRESWLGVRLARDL